MITTTPTTTPAALGCPLGYGSGRFTCQGGDSPTMLDKIDLAIEQLIKQQPQLFNLAEDPPAALGAWLIYDVPAFYDGVIDNLLLMGICAEYDSGEEVLRVKSSNQWSENFDIVSAQARIRRGAVTYKNTCTPANFPLTPQTAVARVSVVSYPPIRCDDPNIVPPALSENKLPVGCRFKVTATPRNALGVKLPPELHGSEVAWFTQFGLGDAIAVDLDPEGNVFNQVISGRKPGEFSHCATVQNVTGCFNGTVIP